MNNWHLLRSKPNQDSIAEYNLTNQGFEVFRPIVGKSIKKGRKNIKSGASLFAGYMFVKLDLTAQDIVPIRSTKGVLGLIRFGKEFASVPIKIIEYIKKQQQDVNDRLLEIESYHKGDDLVIKSGIFKGQNAVFQEYKNSERVVLLLKLISQEQKMTLSLDEI